jgi:hypothetical protein
MSAPLSARCDEESVPYILFMMKILALERPVPGVGNSSFPEELLRDEAEKVWQLYESGVLREIGFRADRREAVLTLECGGPDEAQRWLAELPLVRAELIRFEVIPLIPYPGFKRLFGRDTKTENSDVAGDPVS